MNASIPSRCTGLRLQQLVVALAVAGGLSACATGPAGSPDASANGAYVGVFTGEYVDGKPLYRFPPLHVVGSRRSLDGE